MTKNVSTLKCLLAHFLLSMIGIKDNTLEDSAVIEDDLNSALPLIAENPRLGPVFSKLLNDGLRSLNGGPFNVLLTDERCLALAKILARILGVRIIYTKENEFFDGETNQLTFLNNDDRFAIFVTTVTDGKHVIPLFKKIHGNAHIAQIFTILDYGFPSTESELKEWDGSIVSLLNLDLILDVAENEGLISPERVVEIKKWQSSFKTETDGNIE